MKFRFRKKEDVFVKIIADPGVDEAKWLPACQAAGESRLVKPTAAEGAVSPLKRKLAAFGHFLDAALLAGGQIFMVAVAACCNGILASSLFGQNYDRVMYHSGPQDTLLGVFIIAAIPLFWLGWYLPKHKRTLLVLLLTFCPAFAFFLAFSLSGLPALLLGLGTYSALAAFLYGGAYFSSFKTNWPRSFSVTRWLALLYLPAIALFAYEFSVLDPNINVPEKIEPAVMLGSVAALVGFVFVPCFLASVSAGTRNFASAFGLSSIGQAPLLCSVLIYSVLNAVMLGSFSVFGANALCDYFLKNAPKGMEPDFDLAAGNFSELLFKLISSLAIMLTISATVYAGAALAVLWNRFRQKRLEEKREPF